MTSYRVAIVGCGRMGQHYAEVYQALPDTDVVAIAEYDPERRRAVGERFGVGALFPDAAAMLREVVPDIAAVVLPGKYIKDAVVACAEAGVRGVSTDKPIGACLADVDAMVEVCRERGVVFAGGNLHFGVREHAMAAITNGIALDGTLIPYCGTFMIFSDYMRPAIRLAALMKVRSVFVFTHDSIFLGEDGPTHQPVEQLDSLRAVPNFPVFRPADGIETAMAYAWILECADGPAMLALTRQDLPVLERSAPFEAADVWRGGYIVRDSEGPPAVVLVATGSEVPLACAAADSLAGEGVAARVGSLPCLELFRQQTMEYQEAIVPDDGTPLVAVEAGLGESLRAVVGRKGLIYGMKGFGASAPWQDLAEHFGFTPEKLTKAVLDFVRS